MSLRVVARPFLLRQNGISGRPVQRTLTAEAKLSPKEATKVTLEVEGGMMEGAAERDLGNVVRHGVGDACIVLNVGGKEFMTLRSTVNSNPVLADHVARAEANREVTKSGAIFIDRDPEHFQFILTFLRNKVEMLSYTEKSKLMETVTMTKFTETYARLPEDRNQLRDLYLEATYYRIPELQDTLSRTNWFVKFTDLLGAGNPFDAATKWANRIRTFLVSFATFSTLGGTVLLAVRSEFDVLLKTMGLREKESEEEEVGWLRSFGFGGSSKKKDEEKKPPSVLEALGQMSAGK